MKKIIALLSILLIIFGCKGPEEKTGKVFEITTMDNSNPFLLQLLTQ